MWIASGWSTVGLVENDHAIEALAANCADDAFHAGELPRGSRLPAAT
jgi:hypothetical protein